MMDHSVSLAGTGRDRFITCPEGRPTTNRKNIRGQNRFAKK